VLETVHDVFGGYLVARQLRRIGICFRCFTSYKKEMSSVSFFCLSSKPANQLVMVTVSTSSIVLLAACFGIAYEVRRMLKDQESVVASMPQPAYPIHMSRKAWLRSDRRKEMEAVAVRQGWVQFVDATTKKKFWHCPVTKESFHELVFVGYQNVRLNRWCTEDGFEGTGRVQIPTAKEARDMRIPTPEETALHDRTRGGPARPMLGDTARGVAADGGNSEDETVPPKGEDADDADDEPDGKDVKRKKRNPRENPIKGRHTKGRNPKHVMSAVKLRVAEAQRVNREENAALKASKASAPRDSDGFLEMLGSAEDDIDDDPESAAGGGDLTAGLMNGEISQAETEAEDQSDFSISLAMDAAEAYAEDKSDFSVSLAMDAADAKAEQRLVPQPKRASRVAVAPKPASGAARQYEARPVFFMHLHKAAGTTLCELAVANKARAAGMKSIGTKEFGFNCNIMGDDPGHLGLGVQKQESTHGQADGLMSCRRRADFMKKNKFTFSAIERWIFPHEICTTTFIYMTCLRNPISRIKSSIKFHVKQTEAQVVHWATKHEFSASAPISTGSPSVDNFYVRSFAGKEAYLKVGKHCAGDICGHQKSSICLIFCSYL